MLVTLSLLDDDLNIIAVCGFEGFDGVGIEGMIAGRPGNKRFIKEVFKYVFDQLQVRRFTVRVSENNEAAYRFDLKLGFIEEGRLRQAGKDGEDIIILGMLRNECKWLSNE
ncbi:MAG: GNAT family N-acetyltransferase [Aequoribacter sp.]|uniref:GNAT family N-acetyltransferase n=1 Tax=Aequoribacter sp. TaxID=2847771 RepID=UPI003C49F0C2